MKIVLVVPCFNEESRLKIQVFNNHDSLNFLFVNDGSKDGTEKLLKSIEGPRCKVVNLEKNSGKAEAVRKGMMEALVLYPEASWIGFWDADLATPLDEVDFLLAYHAIHRESFQAVFGSRVLRLGSKINRNFLRHILGRLFVTYSSVLLGSHAYDSQCGAKLFRKEIVKDTFNKPFISKWFFDMEVIQRLSIRKVSILECPLQSWEDVSGSKLNPLTDGVSALIEIFKIRKEYGKIKNF